jgi:UDP-N-acetylglucosamine--N-acetylmuramyl-(pentapeptide) pyrophosphoryl-undecaprenol N-acetylglucosamine transferase
MRMIVAGGGTGGHLFPAIAVARKIVQENAGAWVLFVGSRWGIEAEAVEREGFPFEPIPIRGVVGRGLKGILQALWGIPVSLVLSMKILKRFRPEVVLGVGGYAAGPPLVAAALLRIPTAIMEQNVRPGITNRLLGRWARKVFLGFEESGTYYDPRKTECTGIPIRWETIPARVEGKFTLLVLGGSAGAHRINQEVVRALGSPNFPREEIRIIHQTGKNDEVSVRETYRDLGFRSEVAAFFSESVLSRGSGCVPGGRGHSGGAYRVWSSLDPHSVSVRGGGSPEDERRKARSKGSGADDSGAGSDARPAGSRDRRSLSPSGSEGFDGSQRKASGSPRSRA